MKICDVTTVALWRIDTTEANFLIGLSPKEVQDIDVFLTFLMKEWSSLLLATKMLPVEQSLLVFIWHNVLRTITERQGRK